MDDAESRIGALLAESSEQAARRREQRVAGLHADGDIILFGAGSLGRRALRDLRKLGIEPVAFIDETPEKQGAVLDGVRIYPVSRVASLSDRAAVVVTIVNPKLPFLRAKDRLRQFTKAPAFSYVELSWKFPDRITTYYQFDLPERILDKAGDIRRALDVLTDNESRDAFATQLFFRLHLDYDALPPPGNGEVLGADVLPTLTPGTTFVDCGAYDGDSIHDFLKRGGGKFSRIVAFEPDPANFAKLQAYVGRLEPRIASRISLHRAAVGARRGGASFSATGDMGAAMADAGESRVEVVTLDETVEDDSNILVKFDIEGAELDALHGARGLIGRCKPTLALAAYHRPGDLWELPLFLRGVTIEHNLYVRALGSDGMDFFCYAVPKGRRAT